MNHYEKEEILYDKNYRKRVSNKEALRIVRGTLSHFKFHSRKVILLSNRNQLVPRGFVGIWFYGTIDTGSFWRDSSKIRLSNRPSIGLIAHEISHAMTWMRRTKYKPHGKEFREWNRRVQKWCERYR